MLRLVVTASGTGPIAASSATYMAKSASAIMVGPEIVPPGRIKSVAESLPHPAAAVPDRLDRKPAVRMEHLRESRRRGSARAL